MRNRTPWNFPEITPVGVLVGGKLDQFCSIVAWSVLGISESCACAQGLVVLSCAVRFVGRVNANWSP